MAIPRCYAGPDPLAAGQITLSEAESHHALASRRLRPGDEVVLFDGGGGEGHGRIKSIERRVVRVRIDEVQQRGFDASPKLTLAVAMPKGPRQDVLVEKCTELGIKAFWPISCERSIAVPSEHRLAKLRRTCVEACKQSQRSWLPEIAAPARFSDVVGRRQEFGTALLIHPEGDSARERPPAAPGEFMVLVGPEGGFTQREAALAISAGFTAVRLGSTILRTETAAIAVAAQLLL